MHRALLTLLALTLLALTPSALAEGVKYDPNVTQACFAGGGWTECIGQATNACMQATPGGNSTAGMAACLGAERDWWQAELDVALALFLDHARADDADFPVIDGMVPRPSMHAAAQELQAAWDAWREVRCQYEELRWWGGTGAAGAGTACRMRLTGEQVLTLRSLMAEG